MWQYMVLKKQRAEDGEQRAEFGSRNAEVGKIGSEKSEKKL